jgi:hypothetical protein
MNSAFFYFQIYGWATFKKMGAGRTIARAYKCALALSICIQLEFFFYVASVGSYLDVINKNLLGAKPHFRTLYLVGLGASIVCVFPWLSLVSHPVSLTLAISHVPTQAWYGIRRESKRMMYAFFTMSILYLGLSGAMFGVSKILSGAMPVFLTPSRHVVEYLQADLQVLDTYRYRLRSFLGSPHCDRHPR